MYEAKFLGKVVRITWKELQSLKARFNANNFKKIHNILYRNNKRCILCKNYYTKWAGFCGKCPMRVFREGTSSSGCATLMCKMLKVKRTRFDCYEKNIEYYDERGKKQLDRVYAFFDRFKKV
jgi:hypothetical protein